LEVDRRRDTIGVAEDDNLTVTAEGEPVINIKGHSAVVEKDWGKAMSWFVADRQRKAEVLHPRSISDQSESVRRVIVTQRSALVDIVTQCRCQSRQSYPETVVTAFGRFGHSVDGISM
jgi:hypothetical protein